MPRLPLLLVVVLCAVSGPATGATLRVPAEFKHIQEAVDAARPGDVVLVDPGTYGEPLVLRAGVTVRSAGDDTAGKIGLRRAEATVIDGGGDSAQKPAVVLAEDAALDGFTVTRVGRFDEQEYQKHHATHGENLPDERGAVGTGKDFTAVSLAGVTATVRNCIVHDNGHPGIGCTATEGKPGAAHIVGNVAYRNMGSGIGIAAGAAPLVESNRCYNNLRSGIGSRAARPRIVGNECFDNVRAGIACREGARPTIRGNRCHHNRRAGIGCRMEGTAPLIVDNDCYENAMAGIGCRDRAEPTIRGNRCHRNTLAGIGSRDGARPTITGNRCYQNKEAGIGTESGARALIVGNECYENEKAGIGQRGEAEVILEGNHVHHNKAAGLGFEECKAGRATVLRNRVVENALVAVGVHSGWSVRLADNEFSRTGGLPPLAMVFKGATADFVGNSFQGSGVAAVRTEGVVRLHDNRFHCPSQRKGGGPPQFAVWGLPGSDIEFSDNTVQGWRHALSADRATVRATGNTVTDYWQIGIKVTNPTTPVTIVGNHFRSAEGHPGVSAPTDGAAVRDNRVQKAEPPARP